MEVRLLLVDDDPCVLQAVSQTLRHFLPAVSIDTCMNPTSALVRLLGGSFSVVLSDFNMPLRRSTIRVLRRASALQSQVELNSPPRR